MKTILVLHHESGDEIHLNFLDYALWEELSRLTLQSFHAKTQQTAEELIQFVLDNSLDHMMCQTYVAEEAKYLQRYEIETVINIPELGT